MLGSGSRAHELGQSRGAAASALTAQAQLCAHSVPAAGAAHATMKLLSALPALHSRHGFCEKPCFARAERTLVTSVRLEMGAPGFCLWWASSTAVSAFDSAPNASLGLPLGHASALVSCAWQPVLRGGRTGAGEEGMPKRQRAARVLGGPSRGLRGTGRQL